MKLLVSLLLLFSLLPTFAKPKIAVVNFHQVFENYHLKLKADQETDAQIQELKTSPRILAVQEMDAKLKDIANTVRDPKLAMKTRKLAEEDFNSLFLEHRSLVKEMHEFIAVKKKISVTQQVDTLEKLIAIARKTIAEIGQENGFDMILEIEGLTSSQISPIIYIRDKTDITSLVLARLNEDAPGEPSP